MCSTCDCERDTTKGFGLDEVKIDESTSPKCRKCGAKPFIILNKIHVDCQNCFLDSCNKKIKSTIGKSQLIKNNDSVIIAHSGGASSTALLSLIKDNIYTDQGRQQKFRPSILHLDTRSSLGLDFERCKEERLLHLRRLLEQTHNAYPDWPLYWTTLETSLSKPNASAPIFSKYDPKGVSGSIKCDLLLNNSHFYTEFQDSIHRHQDLTEKQRYIQKATTTLIDMVASAINSSNANSSADQIKFVLVANSATQLANNLLVDVILGEGSTIASTVNVCDTRPQVPIFRPMRDFSKKEIAFYLRSKCLEFYTIPNVVTLANQKASIQKLTESFLSRLYIDYPSTYSTLLRTGNKLQD